MKYSITEHAVGIYHCHTTVTRRCDVVFYVSRYSWKSSFVNIVNQFINITRQLKTAPSFLRLVVINRPFFYDEKTRANRDNGAHLCSM